MQNNLFKRVLTVTVPQSQINQILLFRSWPLQSYKTTQLNHSYKLCEDGLIKISVVTVYYHVASLRLIYTCIYDWGGEGVRVELSMYKMYRKLTDWNNCHFWWQPSYEYTVLFLLLLLLFFLYNFVVIFGIWVFGIRSSLPRTGCYSLKKKNPKVSVSVFRVTEA